MDGQVKGYEISSEINPILMAKKETGLSIHSKDVREDVMLQDGEVVHGACDL